MSSFRKYLTSLGFKQEHGRDLGTLRNKRQGAVTSLRVPQSLFTAQRALYEPGEIPLRCGRLQEKEVREASEGEKMNAEFGSKFLKLMHPWQTSVMPLGLQEQET